MLAVHLLCFIGALVWYVASELFFSFSPNSVYSKALKIVKKDLKVQGMIFRLDLKMSVCCHPFVKHLNIPIKVIF